METVVYTQVTFCAFLHYVLSRFVFSSLSCHLTVKFSTLIECIQLSIFCGLVNTVTALFQVYRNFCFGLCLMFCQV